jgi:hypothetical protein
MKSKPPPRVFQHVFVSPPPQPEFEPLEPRPVAKVEPVDETKLRGKARRAAAQARRMAIENDPNSTHVLNPPPTNQQRPSLATKQMTRLQAEAVDTWSTPTTLPPGNDIPSDDSAAKFQHWMKMRADLLAKQAAPDPRFHRAAPRPQQTIDTDYVKTRQRWAAEARARGDGIKGWK